MNQIALATLVLLPTMSSAAAEPERQTFVNSLGATMVRIEPGEFAMGTPGGPPVTEAEWKQRDWDESPAHKVTITRAFHLGSCEVTNSQYEQFDPAHRKWRGLAKVSETDDEPVTMVSWQNANDFCRWLSEKEGRPYRLPTEAEWEYACRAGSATLFHCGDTLSPKDANIAGTGRVRTRVVNGYKPNAWGLYDMHGNVEEWCWDWYGPYAGGPQSDPVGVGDGYVRVTRGGSYEVPSWQKDNARYARCANRAGRLPDDANRCTGFRVALGVLPKTAPLPIPEPPRFARGVAQSPAPKAEPDPRIPYFDNFKGRRATIPENTWGPIFSQWNHFTACCVCPNGDVLACWYTTKSESGRELAQAASRLPAGSDRWQPASLFFDVPDVNDHAPVLLTHKGRIYHFASQSLRSWDETTNVMRVSDDNGATWSKPQIIARREGDLNLSQACSGFVTEDGTIYLAVDGNGHRTESLMVGANAGTTWTLAAGDLRKAMGDEYAIHPAMVPGEDGSIVVFLRGPDPMPRLVSADRGASWQAGETPLGGIGVGQKAAALRLQSGALLLCAPDTRKPPITGRRGTLAALSNDDGATWSHVRPVPDVGGYMSAAQAPNGIIYLFGTRMSCVAFNEAWVREGPPIK